MILSDFFKENKKFAIAFSGGVDSAYLFYAAVKYGAEVTAYYVRSEFQPQFELDDAVKLAKELNAVIKIIETSVLNIEKISSNPDDRCYHCKKHMLSLILSEAKKDGYQLLLDGTNASDDECDRPGMRALSELSVRSPLKECGLGKSDIRKLSKEAGLFTWDKPSYSCLATRIHTGVNITKKNLSITEDAEKYLFSLGFSDFRIRMNGENAVIQLPEDQMAVLIENKNKILPEMKKHYKSVLLDLEGR